MKTVSVNGDGVVRYIERGTGPPVMLLPGLGCNYSVWWHQVDYLSRWYRVLAVEPRGVGGSSRLNALRNVLKLQARDLSAVLDDAGVEKCVVAGVSYGGVLAQRFALDYPSRASGIVLVDSFCSTDGSSVVLLDVTGWLWFLPMLMRPVVRAQYNRWPEVRAYMDRCLRELRRWETVKIRYALNRVDYTAELGALSVPLLAISSDHPALSKMAEQSAEAAPDSRVIAIKDSFDPSTLCQPEKVNAALSDFLCYVNA